MVSRRHKRRRTPYTQAGMIKNVKATTKYKMTFNYSEEDYHDGGAILDIQVDETTLDITDEIVIAKRPEISGNGFNIASPVYCEVGIGSAVSVWINASSELKNLVLSCDKFTSLGIPVNEFDFITMTPDAYNTVSSLGISLKRAYNEETDQDNAKVILSEPFTRACRKDNILSGFQRPIPTIRIRRSRLILLFRMQQ